MNFADGLDPSGSVARSETLDYETLDKVIDSLLTAEPPPYVMAFAENGLEMAVPATVPSADGHAISTPGTALELCLPSDFPGIIEAWQLALVKGSAQATVHLLQAPDRPIRLYFINARHRYGVYLGVIVGSDGIRIGGQPPPLFRRRACSMQRDSRAVIVDVDAAFTEVLGWTAEEIVGRQTMNIIHPDDKASGIAKWMEMLHRPGNDQRLMLRLAHRDGTFRWFEVTNRNLLGDPRTGRVLTELIDVSDRMDALEALRANEELLRRLTQALPIGIAQIDAYRRIVYQNELLCELLGVANVFDVAGQFALVASADWPAFQSAVHGVLSSGADGNVEVTIDLPAYIRRCSIAIRALRAVDGAITGAIICVSDVTERARLSAELERRATIDELTGCYNRASILTELEATLSTAEQVAGGIAVIFIDLNRFKEINDRHGHAAGDRLLQLSAERIKATVRDVDLVGRLGGDEFLIVCPDIAAPETALEIARRVAAALTEPTGIGAASIRPGASIGVAWTKAATDCDALVAVADEAMYESKRGAAGPILALDNASAAARN